MATVIRFSRHGSKKKPYFRIVVQDKRSPRDGRFIEHIGAYNPVKGDDTVVIERERLEYWLGTGAEMSTSVKNRLKPAMKSWKAAGAEASTAEAPVAAPVKAKAPKAKTKEA